MKILLPGALPAGSFAAWLITLPAAGLVAAGAVELSDAIGGGWGR